MSEDVEAREADLRDAISAGVDKALDGMLFDYRSKTLQGDVHNDLMKLIRSLDKPFDQLDEYNQTRIINATDLIAKTVVRNAVLIVGDVGFPAMVITLGKFTIDGAKLKGTYEARADEEAVGNLMGAEQALIVFATTKDFADRKAEIRAKQDEPPLPLDDGEADVEESDQQDGQEDRHDADPVATAAGAAFAAQDAAAMPPVPPTP